MRIRVTTRTELFEKRKQQHIERGYRIEDECPMPVNGLCPFIAVREQPVSDTVGELVAEAFNGARRSDRCGARYRSKSGFGLMENALVIPVTTRNAMDAHPIGNVKG